MIQLTDATLLVNNEAVGYLPNTLKFREGLGEQKVRSVAIGGGKTEQVYAQDLETNVGMVAFELPATIDNIALARKWKTSGNRNVVSIAGSTLDGDVNRSFTLCAVTNDYDVEIGTDTSIPIEIHGNAAI